MVVLYLLRPLRATGAALGNPNPQLHPSQALPSVVYEAHQCDTRVATSSSSSSSSSSFSTDGPEMVQSRRLSGGGGAPMYAEINELATLLLQNQDEVLLQLF